MSDDSPKSGQNLVKPERGVVPAGRNPDNADETSVQEWQELIELERERLSNARDRISLTREMFKLHDAEDQREHEYQMARLGGEMARWEEDDRRLRRMYLLFTVGVSVAGAIILFLLAMLFFGDETRQEAARPILRGIKDVILSGSLITLLVFFGRSLLRRLK